MRWRNRLKRAQRRIGSCKRISARLQNSLYLRSSEDNALTHILCANSSNFVMPCDDFPLTGRPERACAGPVLSGLVPLSQQSEIIMTYRLTFRGDKSPNSVQELRQVRNEMYMSTVCVRVTAKMCVDDMFYIHHF